MSADSRCVLGVPYAANAENFGSSARASLLVLVGGADRGLALLHTAQQLAAALDTHWTVINVETASRHFLSDRKRDRQLELMRVAQVLGADVVTLHGTSAAKALANDARLRGASRILLGSPAELGWRALEQYAQLAALRRMAPDLDIVTVATRQCEPPALRSPRARRRIELPRLRDYLLSLLLTSACTLVGLPLAGHVDLTNIVMIYMLGAALAGLLLGRGPSALTAVLSILAFDFFFVPPLYTLTVLDPSHLVTFTIMLIVALIIANLLIALRGQTTAAAARAQHAAALYAITRDLAVARDTEAMVGSAVRHIGEVLQCHARVLLCDEDGRIIPPDASSRPSQLQPEVDLAVAEWVASKRERAGAATAHFSSASARYMPLRGSHATIGVLVAERAQPADALLPEQQHLLEAIADQLALALERARMTQLAQESRLSAERTAMRNTLLTSISHDLRTPLSAIAGAGSMLAQSEFALDGRQLATLGRLVESKARAMSDLLTNVLELVRLEAGGEVLNRDWHAVPDLVGLALQSCEGRLAGWQVSTDLPSEVPMISVDATLIVQLLTNLLENATKYTPRGTRILIGARRSEAKIRLSVEDNGPGFGTTLPEMLFEKFARGRTEGNADGVGLGLTICRVIARLHGGEICAASAAGGGARFDIILPLPATDAALECDAASGAE